MRDNTPAGRLVRGLLSAILLLGLTPVEAAMELGQQAHFDIPPQELPSALLKFSAQSGVQVTSPGQLVEGKKSQGAVGNFSATRALELLLKDTTLVFEVVDGRTVVITAAAPRPARRELQRVSEMGNGAAARSDLPPVHLAQATTTSSDVQSGQISDNNTRGSASGQPLEEVIDRKSVV